MGNPAKAMLEQVIAIEIKTGARSKINLLKKLTNLFFKPCMTPSYID
jgi:hypothetical protein